MQHVAAALDDMWAFVVRSKYFIEELWLFGSRVERLDPCKTEQVGKDVRFDLLV